MSVFDHVERDKGDSLPIHQGLSREEHLVKILAIQFPRLSEAVSLSLGGG